MAPTLPSSPSFNSPSCGATFSLQMPQVREVVTVPIIKRERLHGVTAFETTQRALEAFHRDSVAILQDAVSHESLDHVHDQMKKDLDILLSSTKRPHFNHDASARNLSQHPPLSPGYLHEDIWANRHALAIIENLIGPRPQLAFVGANTALPKGTGRQALHSDAYFQHLDFTFGAEVNIFLDTDPANNVVKVIWLGIHHGYNHAEHQIPSTRGWIKKLVLEDYIRTTSNLPVQPMVPKRSLMIRDLRTWHAGMPNKTDEPRIMLGFIFFPAWYRTPMRLTFPLVAQPVLRSWRAIDAVATASFVDDEVDHLNVQFVMNLTQEDDGGIGRTSLKKRLIGKNTTVSKEHYWALV